MREDIYQLSIYAVHLTGDVATYSQRLLMFDALSGTFRTIKLRPRQSTCVVCGDSPSITQLIDYEQFCGAVASDKVYHTHQLPYADVMVASYFVLLSLLLRFVYFRQKTNNFWEKIHEYL